jgi:hypothetical protein
VYEYICIVEFGQVHERTMRVFGLEPLEHRSRVPGLTHLAIDLRRFGPLITFAQLHIIGVLEQLFIGFQAVVVVGAAVKELEALQLFARVALP